MSWHGGEIFQTATTVYSKVLRQENTWHMGELEDGTATGSGEDEVRETGRAWIMQTMAKSLSYIIKG